jgi:hypothetical protein
VKITNIHFERKFNLPNYQNETLAVDIVLEGEGESPDAALELARDFVYRNRPPDAMEPRRGKPAAGQETKANDDGPPVPF